MKKKLLWLLSIFIVIAILIGGFILYIAPEEDLTMDYKPVDIEEKMIHMIRNLKPEIILSESDINAIVKSSINTALNEQLVIEGAHFTVGDNKLYAYLNVRALDAVPAALNAVYTIQWQEPQLVLIPVELKLKQITLPTTWLKEITVPIYEIVNDKVTIKQLGTVENELVIRFKFNLF